MHFTETRESKMKWSLLFRKGIMELEFKSILQTSLLIIIIMIIIIICSRNFTRWLFFPMFPLEFRIFVLVEGRKPEDRRKTLAATTRTNINPTYTSNITLSLFVLVTAWNSWFIEKRNSFLAHVNPSGPTHFSFIMIFNGIMSQWNAPGRYHNSHYLFSSVADFSLGNLIKLTFCFVGRKQQFSSQL